MAIFARPFQRRKQSRQLENGWEPWRKPSVSDAEPRPQFPDRQPHRSGTFLPLTSTTARPRMTTWFRDVVEIPRYFDTCGLIPYPGRLPRCTQYNSRCRVSCVSQHIPARQESLHFLYLRLYPLHYLLRFYVCYTPTFAYTPTPILTPLLIVSYLLLAYRLFATTHTIVSIQLFAFPSSLRNSISIRSHQNLRCSY